MMYMSPQKTVILKNNADNNMWGFISTPYSITNLSNTQNYVFCIDNGSFSKKFDWSVYKKFLLRQKTHINRCLFATIPDVVGDSIQTLELYKRYSKYISDMGYEIAFVLQDGIEYEQIPKDCNWLFVGGTTEFKMSKQVVDIIQRTDKKVHVGRVNSEKRIRYFYDVGVDTVDGTTICFEPNTAFNKINTLLIKLNCNNIEKQERLF